MSVRSDFVFLEVEGERIDLWTEYSVDSDLLTPADAFSFSVHIGEPRDTDVRTFDLLREVCSPNASVKLYVGDDVTGRARDRYLQLSGIIDDREVDRTQGGGGVIRIEGRDRAAHLCDSACPIGLVRESNATGATFADLARAACEPWGIEVISDQAAARDVLTGATGTTAQQRLEIEQMTAQGISTRMATRAVLRRAQREGVPLDEAVGTTPTARSRRRSSSGMVGSDIERQTVSAASPQPGESVWDFLARHAERLGIMMWMDPLGRLILGSPHYSQDARYTFVRRYVSDPTQPNNYESGPVKVSGAGRYSKVTVLGQGHGRGAARTRVRAVVEDTTMPFRRERVERDSNARSQAEADRAATRIAREGQASAEVITIKAPDHGMGRYLYAIDTTANIFDEIGAIDGKRYVTQRTFTRTRDAGTSTQLRLIPLNSLTL